MDQSKKSQRKPGTSRGLRGGTGAICDWGTADAGLLVHAIERASFTGGALRLGYSRDGGAYAVGIYGDGEPYTEYCKASEDLDNFLGMIVFLFETIADEQAQARRTPKKPLQDDLP
jgi:hypothetical protein